MKKHAVVIVGGGPTGMMLAAELALANIDVAIVERRGEYTLLGWRAGGLHSRTIEVFDQRGIAERFISEGQIAKFVGFARRRLDLGDFPSRHPYSLGLWQHHIERILAGWIDELPITIYRGTEVTSFAQDPDGVTIDASKDVALRAEFLVGCDGGRSIVRKLAGIDFPGWDPTVSCLIGQVEMSEQPKLGIHYDASGVHSFGRQEYEIRNGQIVFKDIGPIGVMVTEQHLVTSAADPTLQELSDALKAVYGTDYGVHSPTHISRFTDMTRQADRYRSGRVLLAGDAAHIYAPDGGQGLNIGVQDAVNLGWKLAQVIRRQSPDSLLDTYDTERRPVAYRAMRNSMASVALRRGDERTTALRETMADFLGMDEPRKKIAAMLSGLDVHYDQGEGHPLLGRRIPDLEIITARGAQRIFQLLHNGRPVLLNFGKPQGIDVASWSERVQLIDAGYAGKWELPLLGEVTPPASVLIRPDGYVAWIGEQEQSTNGLTDALSHWFGPPVPEASSSRVKH